MYRPRVPVQFSLRFLVFQPVSMLSWISLQSCLNLYSTVVIHAGEAVVFRMWWLFPTVVLAGLGEVIGWAGRLWSSHSPARLDPYLMQWVLPYSPCPLPFTAFWIRCIEFVPPSLLPHLCWRLTLWYSGRSLDISVLSIVVWALDGVSNLFLRFYFATFANLNLWYCAHRHNRVLLSCE